MRNASTAAAVLALTLPLAAQQTPRDPSGLPKKGDPIVVKGCLRGGALEATDVGNDDESTALMTGLTFRLTGKKDLLKELKQRHESHLVEVRGTLKSDLQHQGGQGATVGRMRITIGTPQTGAAGPQADSKRSLPVVEVSAFEGTETSCVR